MAVITVDVFQFLYILDAGSAPHRAWGQASDLLTFADAGAGRALHGYASDALAFAETAYLSGDQSRSVVDTLVFADEAYRAAHGYAYQNLVIVQSVWGGFPTPGAQVLAFTQAAAGHATKWAADVLAFTETVTVRMVRNFTVTQGLDFSEGATVYAPTASFVGIALPPVTPSPLVTLTTPSGTVVLPAPDFGNNEDLGQTRVQREAMGGTFVIYRDPMWPASDELSLTFSYLSQAQVDALRAAVSGSVGKLCTYVDHEGTSWSVVVTNPDLEVTQPGRTNYTATLKLIAAS